MVIWVMAIVLIMLSPPLSAQEKPSGSTSSGWDEPITPPKTDKTAASQDDTEFMKQAYEAGMTEIELGNVALQNASSEQVRQYAQQLVNDFTKANQELQSLANANAAPAQPSALTNANTQSTGSIEKYALQNDDMDNFNVSGSGLGTGGGTTGTAISRPSQYKGYRRPASRQAYAGTGAGSGTVTGTGSGFGGAVNKNSEPMSALTNLSQPTTNNGADDSRTSATRPSPTRSILSAELSSQHQALKDKLLFLSGTDLDREYVKAAKANHATLVRLLKSEINGGGNDQVKQWASSQQTTISAYQNPVIKASKTKASTSGW